MRRTISLASGCGFSISDVRVCEQACAWSRPERSGNYRLVFVRSGSYRMRAPSLDVLVDPTTAYITRPDHHHQIAHKPGSEDICTEVLLSESFLEETVGVKLPATNRVLFTNGPVDLAHRALVARLKRTDAFELEECALRLVSTTLGAPWHEAASGSPAGSATRRRAVERARELLNDDPAFLGLTGIAHEAGVSPNYLSRIFRQETGETLSRFRNRVRIRRALERIEAGEGDLSNLAVELGFSDHAHFTRTMREEVGITPTSVRREFAV